MREDSIELIKKMIKKEVVTVIFTKKNGEKRKMKCTMSLPEIQKVNPEFTFSESSPPRTPNYDIITVYDLEKLGFRSFLKDNVIEVYNKSYKLVLGDLNVHN